MTLHFRAHPEHGFFETRIEGLAELEVFAQALVGARAHPEWRSDFDELIDLSCADLVGVTSDEVRTLAKLTQDVLESEGGPQKTAVFAPHDLPFGISRAYKAWADNSPESVGVFRTRDEAIAWLTAERLSDPSQHRASDLSD